MVKYPLVLLFSRYCYLKLCSYCHSPSQWHGAKSLIYTNENLSDRLTLYRPVSTKRSYILKQTCSFQLQVCLSMYDLFVDTRRWRVNGSYATNPFNCVKVTSCQNQEIVLSNVLIRSKHLPVHSQQLKHQKTVWNMFEINN